MTSMRPALPIPTVQRVASHASAAHGGNDAPGPVHSGSVAPLARCVDAQGLPDRRLRDTAPRLCPANRGGVVPALTPWAARPAERSVAPIVSNHAVERFLERVPGAGDSRSAAIFTIIALTTQGVRLGARGVYVDGFTFCLDGAVVTTVFRGRHRHLEQQTTFCRRRMAGEARP